MTGVGVYEAIRGFAATRQLPALASLDVVGDAEEAIGYWLLALLRRLWEGDRWTHKSSGVEVPAGAELWFSKEQQVQLAQ